MRRSVIRGLFGLALGLTVLPVDAGAAFAQTTTATMQGTVTDDQGGVLPGATATISNVETGFTRSTTTDERGFFRLPGLPPGTYSLRIELSAFASYVRENFGLTIGQEANIPVVLKIAGLQEQVVITGESPLVETTKSTIGTTISRQQLDSLPLAGRNFTALAQTAPGVTGVGGGGVNAAGQLSRNNSFLIDGASNDDNVVASTRGGFSLEAVREYVVMANQFGAEYGQASGVVVNVLTRSGTNQLTGRGFVFHRDDSFDAQDPFSKAQGSGKAPFSQQRYGAFLGGPIRRDAMHFFGSYEGLREARTSVVTSPLVPVGEREFPNDTTASQYFIKTDNQLPRAQSLAVRYRFDGEKEVGDNIGAFATRSLGLDAYRRDQDVVANHSMVLSSRALNEFRFQFSRRKVWWDPDNYSPPGTPFIDRPSGDFGKASNMPQGRREHRLQIIDNFSYTVGTHDFKTGFDISLINVRSYFYNNVDGTFRFNTDRPFDPNDLSTYPFQFTQNIGDPNLRRVNNVYSVFVQDSWRLRPNLTANIGVRYDLETAFKEAAGVSNDTNNVGPRLGVVWDPWSDGRTAVRGGYGLYYDQAFLNITGNIMLARRFEGVTIVNPGYPDPRSRGSLAPPSRPSTTIASEDSETPNTRQLSLGVKREIWRGFAVSVDGVTGRGYNLFNAPDINYPDPATGQRPNRDFLRIIQYQTNGHSWYKALLVGVERRSGRGLHFGASYTLSRQERDVEDFGFQAQDMNDRAAEKARANNDRRHQLVVNLMWPLPGGLQVGAVAQARSGLPWNITTGTDSNGDTITNDRPDLANPSGDPRSAATYSANFTRRVGNLPRNFGTGPAFFTVDARVSKFVDLGRSRIEVFVEAFNLLNRANLGLPTGNLRSSTFGQPTALATGATPRQVELGLRFDFGR